MGRTGVRPVFTYDHLTKKFTLDDAALEGWCKPSLRARIRAALAKARVPDQPYPLDGKKLRWPKLYEVLGDAFLFMTFDAVASDWTYTEFMERHPYMIPLINAMFGFKDADWVPEAKKLKAFVAICNQMKAIAKKDDDGKFGVNLFKGNTKFQRNLNCILHDVDFDRLPVETDRSAKINGVAVKTKQWTNLDKLRRYHRSDVNHDDDKNEDTNSSSSSTNNNVVDSGNTKDGEDDKDDADGTDNTNKHEVDTVAAASLIHEYRDDDQDWKTNLPMDILRIFMNLDDNIRDSLTGTIDKVAQYEDFQGVLKYATWIIKEKAPVDGNEEEIEVAEEEKKKKEEDAKKKEEEEEEESMNTMNNFDNLFSDIADELKNSKGHQAGDIIASSYLMLKAPVSLSDVPTHMPTTTYPPFEQVPLAARKDKTVQYEDDDSDTCGYENADDESRCQNVKGMCDEGKSALSWGSCFGEVLRKQREGIKCNSCGLYNVETALKCISCYATLEGSASNGISESIATVSTTKKVETTGTIGAGGFSFGGVDGGSANPSTISSTGFTFRGAPPSSSAIVFQFGDSTRTASDETSPTSSVSKAGGFKFSGTTTPSLSSSNSLKVKSSPPVCAFGSGSSSSAILSTPAPVTANFTSSSLTDSTNGDEEQQSEDDHDKTRQNEDIVKPRKRKKMSHTSKTKTSLREVCIEVTSLVSLGGPVTKQLIVNAVEEGELKFHADKMAHMEAKLKTTHADALKTKVDENEGLIQQAAADAATISKLQADAMERTTEKERMDAEIEGLTEAVATKDKTIKDLTSDKAKFESAIESLNELKVGMTN